MIKKIKKLFTVDSKLEELQKSIDVLTHQINLLATMKKPTRYQEIYLTNDLVDYEELKTRFEMKYRRDAFAKYHGISGNLQECIIQYDKVLYFNKDTMNFPELLSKLSELEVLRGFIIDLLFKSNDVLSFYFYAINNKVLYNTVSEIPHIDMDKIFLLDQETDLDVQYYVIVNMRPDKIVIVTAKEDFEIDNRYRKTIIRVLYSIYFEKYFLYHLNAVTD